MTIQAWMSILYPALAACSFGLIILASLFWLTQRRTWLVVGQVIYFVTEFVTFTLLTLTTGANPMFDISQFRPLIVVARLAMLMAMIFYGWQYWRRIRSGN
jgi:hypothetical protein